MPQRIRAGCDCARVVDNAAQNTLPQRIRAGCDDRHKAGKHVRALCHSAFVRVATRVFVAAVHGNALCHSAFVRVATATVGKPLKIYWTLPQRIRAGCDAAGQVWIYPNTLCHSAFARVATGDF